MDLLGRVAEVADEPQVEPRYCPKESRFNSKQAFENHLRDETLCERVMVEVKNSSGVVMNVFRVDNEGHEVRVICNLLLVLPNLRIMCFAVA